jgi:A/G-specific adenine glycosylase
MQLYPNFSALLINWYLDNKRDLPWRDTNDPYKIWLSEIILQQTRIVQGIDYYHRFVKQYPNVFDLANAPVNDVLKLWQGLGYYSRARNLHIAAQKIATIYKGVFPSNFEELKTLKGIGEYTAAAIASIAFNQPVAAVDGNVYRVLARIFDIKTPINSAAAKKEFFNISQQLIDRKRPGAYNQALMELGATCCTPKSPKCNSCPFSNICFAFANNEINNLPVKLKKNTPVNRYFNYLVFINNGHTWVKQRNEKDIWHSLFDFPLVETTEAFEPHQLLYNKAFSNIVKKTEIEVESISNVYTHKLTHQTIFARFYKIKISTENIGIGEKIAINKLPAIAVPRLVDKYLKQAFAESF